MEDKRLNYTTLPRSIWSDWENGLISTPERNLLYILRAQGNPFGYCSVDMQGLAVDTFNSPVDKSYINKLLLSLRSKRYIWYKDRKGHRGSFQVHLDLWLMKDGNLRTLEKHFSQKSVISHETPEAKTETEVDTEKPTSSQRINELKKSIRAIASSKNMRNEFRGYDNENDNEKENKFTDSTLEKSQLI